MPTPSLAARLLTDAGMIEKSTLLDAAVSRSIEIWLRPLIASFESADLIANLEPVPTEELAAVLRQAISALDLSDVVLALWLAGDGGAFVERNAFVDHVADLWYPSRDDVLVLSTASRRFVLIDHEEHVWTGTWPLAPAPESE